jgi:hypothetical protein
MSGGYFIPIKQESLYIIYNENKNNGSKRYNNRTARISGGTIG